MKKYVLLSLLFLCTAIYSAAYDDETSIDDPVADAYLYKSALEYFSQQENNQSYNPLPSQTPWHNDDVIYHHNEANMHDGTFYQRIGRFSDEDYFDESCVDDVIAAAPAAIKKIIVNLLYPPKHKGALPKRLLLVGKPGTGKTTLAKAIACKCDYEYYVIEAPFLLNEYKNSGPQNLLREIYPLLQAGRKVVVILDELTELTDKYKKENDSDSTVASALWILLDSCAQHENIFFIGTSNKARKDLPAQLKSRFDEDIITVQMPHAAARKRMFLHYLKDERHAIDENFLQYLVKKTNGRSAREIEKLVCKAIQFANLRTPRRYTVTQKDFIKALGLWKPYWHPAVVYESIEPHLQPFFKTAFPIILQTIGLIHTIYAAHRQQKNSDEALELQRLGYEFQKYSHLENMIHQKKVHRFNKKVHEDNMDNHEKSLKQQKDCHDESIEVQRDSILWQKCVGCIQTAISFVGVGCQLFQLIRLPQPDSFNFK